MIRTKRWLALAGLALLFAVPAWAQDQQGSAEEAAMMQAWMAYMTPGEPHQILAKGAGEWEHQVKSWMAPGTTPTEGTATSESEMILGGRYLADHFTGNMMGMPFEGHGISGYDNAKKKYFMGWIDNMGTGLMTGWGDYDASTKKITYTGTFTDPVTGEDKAFRSVTTLVDDNNSIFEMYMPAHDGSGEYKAMEIHSVKKTS
jgi:hypothetical protein